MILDLAYNFHWVERGRVARAAQAYAGFLPRLLRVHRIRAVVNLRGRNPGHLWWRYETRCCGAAGVVHRDVKLNSRQLPTRAMLLDLLEAFDTVPRPFLLKCSGGQDRTSFAAALYLVHEHGWNWLPTAQAQFARWPYLHFPRRQQRWLKRFCEFARDEARGTPLREWLADSYDPAAFANWLEAHGGAGSFRGIYGAKAQRPSP